MITKNELYRKIFEDMLAEGILNEVDAYNISFLQNEFEKIISIRLEDYALVYKAGILDD